MPARASKYTRELLEPVIKTSTSVGQVLDKLGLRRAGGNYRTINQRIAALGLDASHFLGCGQNKGKTEASDDGIRRSANFNRKPDSEVFRLGSTYTTSKLGKRLRASGRAYACERCGNDGTWRGATLTLHVDHIDGDLSNATKPNLRFLCPNCHQQTRTWGAKNRKVEMAP